MSETMTDQEWEQGADPANGDQPAPSPAPAESGEAEAKADEAKTEKAARVKYVFEVLDDLPEAVPAPTIAPKKSGSTGWRGRVQAVIDRVEAGELVPREDGVTPWVKLADYTSGDGAENAYKAIAKRQRKYKAAIANDEVPEEESVLPDGWNAEIEHRRLGDSASILAIRVWKKEEAAA